MPVFQRKQDFASIEFGLLGSELSALNMPHQIATGYKLHDKIKARFCLKARVQIDQEGVLLLSCDLETSLF